MQEPIAHNFHIEHVRKGVPGGEIVAGAEGISVARTTFWAVVDQRGGSLHSGDSLFLRQGARVILQYPPERPGDPPPS